MNTEKARKRLRLICICLNPVRFIAFTLEHKSNKPLSLLALPVIITLLFPILATSQSFKAKDRVQPHEQSHVSVIITSAPEKDEWSSIVRLAHGIQSGSTLSLFRLKGGKLISLGDCSTEVACRLLLARSAVYYPSTAEVQAWVASPSKAQMNHGIWLMVVDRNVGFSVARSDHGMRLMRTFSGRFTDVLRVSSKAIPQESRNVKKSNQRSLHKSPIEGNARGLKSKEELSAVQVDLLKPVFSSSIKVGSQDISSGVKGQSLGSDVVKGDTNKNVNERCSLAWISMSRVSRSDQDRKEMFERVLGCWQNDELSGSDLKAICRHWFDNQMDDEVIAISMIAASRPGALPLVLRILYDSVLSGSNLCSGQSLVRRLFEVSGSRDFDQEAAKIFGSCSVTSSSQSHGSIEKHSAALADQSSSNEGFDRNALRSKDQSRVVRETVREAASTWMKQAFVELSFIGDVMAYLKGSSHTCSHCTDILEHIAFHSALARTDSTEQSLIADFIAVQRALLIARESGVLRVGVSDRKVGSLKSIDQLCIASPFWDSMLCSKGANSQVAKNRFNGVMLRLLGQTPEEVVGALSNTGNVIISGYERPVKIKASVFARVVGDSSQFGYSKERRLLEVFEVDTRPCIMVLLSRSVPVNAMDTVIEVVNDSDGSVEALNEVMEQSHLILMNWMIAKRAKHDNKVNEVLTRSGIVCSLSQKNVFKCLIRQPVRAQLALWESLQHQSPEMLPPENIENRSQDREMVVREKIDLSGSRGMERLAQNSVFKCIQEWSSGGLTAMEEAARKKSIEGYEGIIEDLYPAAFVLLRRISRLSSVNGCSDNRMFRLFQLMSMKDPRRVDIAALAMVMIGRVGEAQVGHALDGIISKIVSLSEWQVSGLMKVVASAHCGGFSEAERKRLSTYFIDALDGIQPNDASRRLGVSFAFGQIFSGRQATMLNGIVDNCVAAHSWEVIWTNELLVVDVERSIKSISSIVAGDSASLLLPDKLFSENDDSIVRKGPRIDKGHEFEKVSFVIDEETIVEGREISLRHDANDVMQLVVMGSKKVESLAQWDNDGGGMGVEQLHIKLEVLQWRCFHSGSLEEISVGMLLQALRSTRSVQGNEGLVPNANAQKSLAHYWLAYLESIAETTSSDAIVRVLSFLIWR